MPHLRPLQSRRNDQPNLHRRIARDAEAVLGDVELIRSLRGLWRLGVPSLLLIGLRVIALRRIDRGVRSLAVRSAYDHRLSVHDDLEMVPGTVENSLIGDVSL